MQLTQTRGIGLEAVDVEVRAKDQRGTGERDSAGQEVRKRSRAHEEGKRRNKKKMRRAEGSHRPFIHSTLNKW